MAYSCNTDATCDVINVFGVWVFMESQSSSGVPAESYPLPFFGAAEVGSKKLINDLQIMRGKRLDVCGPAKMSTCQSKTKESRSIFRQLLV